MVHVDAFGTVIDVHEASGLISVTPDHDLSTLRVERFNDLAAHGGRCFLTSCVPRPERAVDVVKPHNEGLHAALGPVLLAENLRHKLFPSIASFRHGGTDDGFLERPDVRVFLQTPR